MKLSEILTEGRSQAISEDDFNQRLPQFSQILSKKPIYRGLSSMPYTTEFLFVEPSIGKDRESANTYNFVTLLVDNMKSWAEYPKRSKSLICSTNLEYAWDFGQTYRVLPLNGSKIGVCPAQDWWGSFTPVNKISKSIQDINVDIAYLLNHNGIDIKNITYDRLIKCLKQIKPENVNPEYNLKDQSFLEKLQYLLDVNNSKFKLQTTSTFRATKNNEVWTDGPALLINTDSDNYKRISKRILSKIF